MIGSLRGAALACLTLAAAAAWAQSGIPAAIEVSLNGQAPVVVLAAERDGQLFLSTSALRQLGLRTPDGTPAFTAGGEPFHRLEAAGVTLRRFDAREGRAELSAPPGAFPQNLRSLRIEPIEVSAASPAAFLNYDLVLNAGPTPTAADGVFELVGSTRFGILSHAFIQRGFAGEGDRRNGHERLATSYRYDWINTPATLELGDATVRPGAFGLPLRFAGATLYTNYGLRPGFIAQPLPRFSGEAALPSTVDVFINGQLRNTVEVPAGPFTLDQVPVITGAGQARLVIRDALGRERLVDSSFYSAGRLLRPGLSEFALAAGSLREPTASGAPAYGNGYASALWREGVGAGLTLEGRLESESGVTHVAGAAAAFTLPAGEAEVLLAASRTDGALRWLGGAGYRYLAPRRAVVARWERAQDGFRLAGISDPRRATQRQVVITASQQLVPGLSVGVGWIERRRADRQRDSSVSADLVWGLRSNVTLLLSAARAQQSGAASNVLRLTVNLPLGPRTLGTLAAEGGALRQRSASVQQALPPNEGLGYRLYARDDSRGTRAEAALLAQTSTMQLSGEASAAADQPTALRLGARGSIGSIGSIGTAVFAARAIDDAVALIRVPDLDGAAVLLNNQPAGRTDGGGRLILARVTALVPHDVRVDIDTLPADATVVEERTRFVAGPRNAVVATLDVRRVSGALLRVTRPDGSALPTGAPVRAAEAQASRVGPRGEIFVRARPGPQRLHIDLDDAACRIEFDLPAPMPSGAFHEIGPLRCQPGDR